MLQQDSQEQVCSELFKLGGLSAIGLALYAKLHDLEQAPSQEATTRIRTELHLRQVLNLLFEMLMCNAEDPSMRQDFCSPSNIAIEEICMKAIKYSLEISMVPIKKFIIIFQVYLLFLFGKDPTPGDLKSYGAEKFTNLKYSKDLAAKHLQETENEKPRALQHSNHPVELFYKRNTCIPNEHPIPQIIVVGTLRVLLTTCQNNNRSQQQGVGIDLHLEWGSCIDLLGSERHLFEEHEKYGPVLSQIPSDSENFKHAYFDL